MALSYILIHVRVIFSVSGTSSLLCGVGVKILGKISEKSYILICKDRHSSSYDNIRPSFKLKNPNIKNAFVFNINKLIKQSPKY